MIHIFCGEDPVAARIAYTDTITTYKNKDVEMISLPAGSILEIKKSLRDNLSLFSTKKIFCVEGLEKFSFKKSTKAKKDEVYEALVELAADENTILLDFEEGKQGRQLKLKDFAKVTEFKPAKSIFALLDDCFPGNKITFIKSLRTVCETQDEMFTLIMLFRHVRLLVVAAHDGSSSKLPPWQKYKIIGQAKKWDKQKLLDYYSGLIKIEINSKTSSNPYGIAKSLEILACHYL